MEANQKWFVHADIDAFFASVEQLDNPQYKGKPVIVGGKPGDRRSVVSTASYEARKFGVHSAMPIFQAYKLCPNGIYLRGRMKRYEELSAQIMEIFRNFSPNVDQMSIDEAFIDLTGTERLFGSPEETARKIKDMVKNETGLTISIGLASNKYIAKIASGLSKPDGFYYVQHGSEQDFMLSLPLKKVWGLGEKSLENLKHAGISTTQGIYELDKDLLSFMFGNSMGTFLYNAVRGKEAETFSRKTKNHSISAENTYSHDLNDIYVIETAIMELAHNVMFRLHREELSSRTITLKIRYSDFTTVSAQESFSSYIYTLDSYFEALKNLFERKYEQNRPIRLLGVGFDNVESNERSVQLELFDDGTEKKKTVEKAIMNLEKKNPKIKIHKARLLDFNGGEPENHCKGAK